MQPADMQLLAVWLCQYVEQKGANEYIGWMQVGCCSRLSANINGLAASTGQNNSPRNYCSRWSKMWFGCYSRSAMLRNEPDTISMLVDCCSRFLMHAIAAAWLSQPVESPHLLPKCGLAVSIGRTYETKIQMHCQKYDISHYIQA